MKKQLALSPIFLAVSGALAALAFVPSVYAESPSKRTQLVAAQDEETGVSKDETTEADAEADKELSTFQVTGSRIPRAGFDTLEPAIVVTRDYIDNRGLTNVADALNEMPGFGVGVTPEGAQSTFGVGVNFVNRFGLGSQRTLTLVNGRRVVSSNTPSIFGPANPGLQVDLNMVPVQLISRIENLAVGGAPTYGSDAIAGVVNVILRKDYEGMSLSGAYGLSQEGDNERVNGAFVWGSNFADGDANITASVAFDRTGGVLSTARDRFNQGYSYQPNPLAPAILTQQPGRNPATDGRVNPLIPFNTGNTDGIPNSVLVRDLRFFTFTAGGLLFPTTGAFNLAGGALRGFGPNQTNYLQFAPNGNIVPFNPGVNFGTVNSVGGDGFNLNQTAQLTSQVERRTANVFSHWNINDSVELFFEGMYLGSNGLELIDQSVYNASAFGGNSAPLTFSADHPFLNAQAQRTLSDLGVTSFRVSRASRDLVNNNGEAEGDLFRGVVGATGTFLVGDDRPFTWEVSANFGRSDGTFFQNVLNQQNFINAINVTRNAAGQIVCDPTGTVGVIAGGFTPVADAACAPLNIFGEGAPSAAARAYVTGQTVTDASLDQQVFNANISGSVFDIWGGPVSFNVGFEHRKEEGEFVPNEFQQLGLGRSVPILPTQGEFDTDEFFGELLVPFINPDDEIPMLNRLDLTLKGRHVDSSVNGGFNAYTYGLQWRPISSFEVRGNKTRSLRAPGIVELFSGTSSIFTTVPDPCDARNVTGGTRPTVRQANCAAFYREFGLNGATFQSNAASATIPGTLSGTRGLKNEKADSSTIGFVWQPEFLPGFRAAVDYYEIEIDDAIANLNAAAIATGCFDNSDFNASDVRNANSFCQRITRNSSGQITGVSTAFVNSAFLDFTGISGELQYGFNLSNGDKVQLSTTVFNLRRLNTSVNSLVVTDNVDLFGNASRQYQFGVTYDHGKFGFDMQANYMSEGVYSNTNTVETQDILSVEDYTLFNAGVQYRVTDDASLRFAVTNVFNTQPPFPLAGGAIGVYDTLGRRYTLSGEWKF
jgi:outer membrane receptor protein involved in Fe transport